jgi:hypothetical protein
VDSRALQLMIGDMAPGRNVRLTSYVTAVNTRIQSHSPSSRAIVNKPLPASKLPQTAHSTVFRSNRQLRNSFAGTESLEIRMESPCAVLIRIRLQPRQDWKRAMSFSKLTAGL